MTKIREKSPGDRSRPGAAVRWAQPTGGSGVLSVVDAAGVALRNLLLEQRVKHDRRAAAVLEPADGIQMIGEGRGARDERIRELEPEIAGRQIDW